MRLFDFLEKKKKRRNAFHNSDEYAYFIKNKSQLKDLIVNLPVKHYSILPANSQIKD